LNGAWWDFTTEECRNEIALKYDIPRNLDHHAAFVETSLLLHIDEHVVAMDKAVNEELPRIEKYQVYPPNEDMLIPSGTVMHAKGAQAEVGKIVAEQVLARAASAINLELRNYN